MNTPSYFCHTGIFSHPLICHEPALFLLPRWDFLQYLPSTIPKGCVFFFKEKSQRFDLSCCVLRQFQKSILVQEKSQSVDVRSPPGGKTHHQQRTDVRYNSHCSTLLLLCIWVHQMFTKCSPNKSNFFYSTKKMTTNRTIKADLFMKQ